MQVAMKYIQYSERTFLYRIRKTITIDRTVIWNHGFYSTRRVRHVRRRRQLRRSVVAEEKRWENTETHLNWPDTDECLANATLIKVKYKYSYYLFPHACPASGAKSDGISTPSPYFCVFSVWRLQRHRGFYEELGPAGWERGVYDRERLWGRLQSVSEPGHPLPSSVLCQRILERCL